MRSVILAVLFVSTALVLLGIFPEEAFAVIPPTPTVISPLSGEAIVLSSANDPVLGFPSFIVDVEVEDTDFNIDMVYVFSNPATGDETIRANLGGPSKQFDLIQEAQSLASILNFDPQTGSFNLEVFSTTRFGSPTAENSPSVFITDLSYAPPPPPIVSSPTSNEVIVDPFFTVEVDIDPSLIPDDIDVVFTFINPDTGDSRVSSKKSPNVDGSWDSTFEASSIGFIIGVAPGEEFILDVFVKIETLFFLESEHVVIDGLSFFLEGCPLPNGGTTTIFGGVTASQGNSPPQAEFEITGFKVRQPITLDGSASFDFDQTKPLKFMWKVTDLAGMPVSVDNPIAEITFFTPTSLGEHTVTLTVTDECGVPDSLMKFVTVRENKPPTANAGEDQNVPAGTIMLMGSGDDPDGDNSALKFLWDFRDRPANSPKPTLVNPNSQTPSFDVSVKGEYTLELTVFDPENKFGTDEVIITINQSPMAVAVATPDMVIVDQVSILDGSGSSDPDGDLPLTFLWEIIKKPEGGPLFDKIVNPNSEMAMFSQGFLGDLGEYQVQLTVTDGTGAEDTAVVTINLIADTNVSPEVKIGQTKLTFTQGEKGILTATADDKEDGDISNQIDWKIKDRDSGTTLFGLMDSNTFSIQNLPVGTFIVEVEIEDSGGLMDTDSIPIEIVPNENKKSTNVPTGLDRSVNQQVGLNGINSINFGFDEVVQEGTIETLLGQLGPDPPSGFTIVSLGFGPQTYLNLSFDGSFTGNVEICVNYDDSGLGLSEERSLHMQHFNENPGLWEDITKNLDTVLNNLCGETDTLSPIAIMSPLVVGGELIPVDTSALLLAGTYSTTAWVIPVIVSAIGIGIVLARKF